MRCVQTEPQVPFDHRSGQLGSLPSAVPALTNERRIQLDLEALLIEGTLQAPHLESNGGIRMPPFKGAARARRSVWTARLAARISLIHHPHDASLNQPPAFPHAFDNRLNPIAGSGAAHRHIVPLSTLVIIDDRSAAPLGVDAFDGEDKLRSRWRQG